MTELQPSVEAQSSQETAGATLWQGPLFVAGTWRSGTSLLYALLNKHPQVALLYEGDLLLLKPLFWTRGASGWVTRWNFWNKAVDRHQLDVTRLPSKISRVEEALAITCQDYARRKGGRIWGDKVVNFYDSLEKLSGFFPAARFVIIWREPAAIFRSIMMAAEGRSWFADRSGMTRRFLMAHRNLRRQRDALIRRGAAVHEIHYERLITDPENIMAGICKFLDVPFIPEVASLRGADESAISEGAHHQMVKSGKIESSLDRADIVPIRIKRKINRYVTLWRAQTKDRWPAIWSGQTPSSAKPSLLERAVDAFVYRCLRALDGLIVVLYCYAPLSILKLVRSIRYRRYETPRPAKERSA
ncbi:MAG: sulfotransferase [Acidobacteriaceae bacterium]|nr:sulfotransferase [Acidobacteriaceae bacterium]